MERASKWDAPPNPSDLCSPRLVRCSDAGDSSPASSDYSSDDGSDFDRYCSANSVLGSASICSSVGEDFSLECHSLKEKFVRSRWGGYDCSSDGGPETSRANGSSESPMASIRTSSRMAHCTKEISASRHGMSDEYNAEQLLPPCFSNGQVLSAFSAVCSSSQGSGGVGETSDEKGTLTENSGNRLNGIHIGGVVALEADVDVFSQCVHSNSEDSMLDLGTDIEDRIHLYEKRRSKLVKETKHEDVNPLINSSMAFGSTDWDEFEQDMAGGGLDSVPLYLDQSFQQQVKHFGTEFVEEVEDIAVISYEAENLPINKVGDGNYVSKISYEEQVIEIPTWDFIDNKYSVKKNQEEDDADPPMKDSEYVNAPGSGSTLSEDNAPKCNLDSLCVGRKIQLSHGEEDSGRSFHEAAETNVEEKSEVTVYPHSYEHSCSHPTSNIGDGSSIKWVVGKDSSSTQLSKIDSLENEVKKLDTYDSYDEMVLEMEQILLDSGKDHGYMYMQANHGYMSQQTNHFRDGSSIGSSGTDDMCPPAHVSSKIDQVEVVGAKQKKGDVSLGERLVGVREYTIYRIKVWSSTDEWEVERRYRDFFALYRQLKSLFTAHGLTLPSAWSNVGQDSRNFFGNASPNVVMERSALIEDCLRSILNSGYSFGIPSPLISFLTPGKAMFKSGLLHSLVPQYLQKFSEDENSDFREARLEGLPLFGKTISLVVEIKPHKSLRQLLEMQHYTCAGCHRHLDSGKTLFRELVQTFGWNRPRFCEYTGQLFCASCHTNDTSVLPARVLHHWDFSLYPVSQLAKAYLESIFDQPMLCVSAVNPFLFSKVPALLHVMDFRKKIGAMLPYVNCPYRSSIQKTLGFRRHLLESNDFFTLRDLVDLSKGPFAALPMMVENILNLILEHITQQCLICYDSGTPCAALQACHDPSSLIFPFQEAEAENCSSCGSVFHKACYINLLGCPCSKTAAISKREPNMVGSHREPVGYLERSIAPFVSKSSKGFLTNILSRDGSDQTWKLKNSSPVILMGSLPSSSL